MLASLLRRAAGLRTPLVRERGVSGCLENAPEAFVWWLRARARALPAFPRPSPVPLLQLGRSRSWWALAGHVAGWRRAPTDALFGCSRSGIAQKAKTLLAYPGQSTDSASPEEKRQGWPQKTLSEMGRLTSRVGVAWDSEGTWPSVPAHLVARLCWELRNGTVLPLLTAPAPLPCVVLVRSRGWHNRSIHNIKLWKRPEV